MKKLLTLTLALIMVLSLTACGEKIESTPSDGSNTPDTSQSGDGSEAKSADDVDFSQMLAGSGSTDVVYGKLDAAKKQAIIDEAKEDGVDVSFSADGSMTVKDTDGSVVVQKPDGTWTIKDEDGEAQYGGKWPDNAFTKMLPKPSLEIVASSTDENSFAASFSGGTVEDARAYAKKVKEAGFSVDAGEQDNTTTYMFSGTNSDGYEATVSFISGSFSIIVEKS